MQKIQLAVKAYDGADINAAFFSGGTLPVKGLVIVSHGFGEHIGGYLELAERLSQAGYASAIFDQRGHGGAAMPRNAECGMQNAESGDADVVHRSAARRKDMRGVIQNYRDFLDDIRAVTAAAKQQAPDVPTALYGHSMGGNIVVNFLLRNEQSGCSCAVLESPWLGLYKEKNPLVKGFSSLIGALSPNIAIFKKLPQGDLTGDSGRADEFKNDSLYHNRISMRMFTGICNGCKYAMANAQKLTIPVFLAFASKDRIISNRAIAQFAGAVEPLATVREYDACHAIHNDVHRETFYRDVIDYLDAHLAAEPQAE